jgi:hypothetical protein
MQSLAVGEYTVKATIKRSASEIGTTASCGYVVYGLPGIVIKSLSPAIIQKPVTAANNKLETVYEITGAKITQITNTFNIAGFSATETIKSAEKMAIESETQSSSIDTINFVFTVTDPGFILKSFKFRFGNYSSSSRIQLSVDGIVYTDETFNFPCWIEYVSPSGIPLSAGSHTIKVYCPPAYFYAYQTSTKPDVPGLTITSSTVYAMEMVYSISTSGVGGKRTVTLNIDDTILPGNYPVSVDASTILDGYGAYVFNRSKANMLTVEELMLDPSIGGVSVNKSGRYVGCETDISVSVSGLADVLAGDTLTISLKQGSTTFYENTGTLSQGASSYSHDIPASAFVGLSAGSYSVTAMIKRGGFSETKSASYTVIAAPTVSLVSI